MFCNSFVLLHVHGAVPCHIKAYVCLTQASQNSTSSSFSDVLWNLYTYWQLASSIIAAMHASLYIPSHSSSPQATVDAASLAELFQKLSRASLVLSETIYLSLSVNTFFLFVYLLVALPLSRCLPPSVTVRLNLFSQALPECLI